MSMRLLIGPLAPPIPENLDWWGRFVMFCAGLAINWGPFVTVAAILIGIGYFTFNPKFHNKEKGLAANLFAIMTEFVDRSIVMLGIALLTGSANTFIALFGAASGWVTSMLGGQASDVSLPTFGSGLVLIIATVVSVVAWFAWKKFYHLAHDEQSWWQDLGLDLGFALAVMFLNYLAYGEANSIYTGAQALPGMFDRWLETTRALLAIFGVAI